MGENNYQTEFITLCRNMKKRKTSSSKDKIIKDLSQMMNLLKLKTEIIDEENFSGKSLIAYNNSNFDTLIIADYNVRDIMYLNYRQRVDNQAKNVKFQFFNTSIILLITIMIAIIGVLVVLKVSNGNFVIKFLGASIIVFSIFFSRFQDQYNAGKTAALFCLIQFAKLNRNKNVAFCFLNETGNEQAMTYLQKTYPNVRKIYINHLGVENDVFVLIKNDKNTYNTITNSNENKIVVEYADNNDQSIIRQFSKGVLISSFDKQSRTCLMPGTYNDKETNLNLVDNVISIINLIL